MGPDRAAIILKAMMHGWELNTGGLHLSIRDGRLVDSSNRFDRKGRPVSMDLTMFITLAENVSPDVWADANEYLGMMERAGR